MSFHPPKLPVPFSKRSLMDFTRAVTGAAFFAPSLPVLKSLGQALSSLQWMHTRHSGENRGSAPLTSGFWLEFILSVLKRRTEMRKRGNASHLYFDRPRVW
jgi:hypothetical protein